MVLSDLHFPNPKRAIIDKEVAAIVAMKPRFVVIAGDSTNGNASDTPGIVAGTDKGWALLAEALEPLRAAHIPVLPVAGNHDSYLAGHRARYATAMDLSKWAGSLLSSVHADTGSSKLAKAPFVYSLDLDGVHLAFTHVVSQAVDPDVASWLEADLASEAARTARLRIVLSHVPAHSAMADKPNAKYVASYGALLEKGKVDVYISGHEHFVWDEDMPFPHGGTFHQIEVGCAGGVYNYGPSKTSQEHAHCEPIKDRHRRSPMACTMPHGGGKFEISAERKGRMIQHEHATFSAITVDGTVVEATPMRIGPNGTAIPFYLQ